MLDRSPELVNVRTVDELLPLHLACQERHSGVAEILLDTVCNMFELIMVCIPLVTLNNIQT